MSSSSREKLSIGGRYLHGRTRRPLTLRYIGLLDTDTTWYGVEYDEPSHGRGHSGEYNGVLFFKTRRPGSGAFVKVAPGALIPGPTFVEALEERYGPVIPDTSIVEASIVEQLDKVSLGTSGIIVEAPMMSKVKAKVGRLENLREVGLEGEWVGSRGKTDLVAIKERLKGVHTLNLSKNLLPSWTDIAEITACLRGLQTLVVNDSRIVDGDHILPNITELHMGNCGLTWTQVVSLSYTFPNVRRLYLNDNPISRMDKSLKFDHLELLSLSGCQFSPWDEIALGLGQLKSLHSLDLSSVPFSILPHPQTLSLTHLVLRDTSLSLWADIDALEYATGGKLAVLRISLIGVIDADTEPINPDPRTMSGQMRHDRSLLVAKLSGLTMLNSTQVSMAERRDAELWYLGYVDRVGGRWGRYDDLSAQHGHNVARRVIPPSGLRSKMITIHVRGRDDPFDLYLLPSASVTLLQRKIARKMGMADIRVWIRMWTVREVDGILDKVAEIENGAVGTWLNHGDVVVIETCI